MKILSSAKCDPKWNEMRITVVLSRFVSQRVKTSIKKKKKKKN